MTTVGMIGFGNMASALVEGWIGQKVLEPSDLYASAAHYDSLCQRAAAYGINPVQTNLELCSLSDIVILAVKPDRIEKALKGCLEILQDKIVVCLAAGWNNARLDALLPGISHISIMPNTPVCVGRGIVVAEKDNTLSEVQKAQFELLFAPIALIEYVEPSRFSIAGTLAGCSPAFTAMYMEALADAGVKYGLPRKTAYELAAQAISGTGAMYFKEGMAPALMKDAVCSPGGTTIKGVSALEKHGFRGAVIAAIEAIEEASNQQSK